MMKVEFYDEKKDLIWADSTYDGPLPELHHVVRLSMVVGFVLRVNWDIFGGQTRKVKIFLRLLNAAWVKCDHCDNYWCKIHRMHAHECQCPHIEDWGDVDPYLEGGPE